MQSGNPALTSVFTKTDSLEYSSSGTMTVEGTANKTMLLLLLAVVSAAVGWTMPGMAFPLLIAGGIGGLIIAIGLAFAPQYASIGGPIYALLQGAAMGALTSVLNAVYPGLAFQAVGLTFGVAATMLVVYTSGLIKVNEQFIFGVAAATGGIFLFYIASFALSFFGIPNPAMGNGLIGIAFSVFVVIIAALNLVIDFAFIEEQAAQGAPDYMEWYGAFGLLVTLVWLYIEIVRLLTKLASSD